MLNLEIVKANALAEKEGFAKFVSIQSDRMKEIRAYMKSI